MNLFEINSMAAAAFWIATNMLLTLVLALNVTKFRMSANASVGTGGNPGLERAIRAHGNNIEYVPLALVAMLLLSVQGCSSFLVHGLGAGLLLGRLMHAHGIQQQSQKLPITRVLGNIVTWAVYLTCITSLYFSLV